MPFQINRQPSFAIVVVVETLCQRAMKHASTEREPFSVDGSYRSAFAKSLPADFWLECRCDGALAVLHGKALTSAIVQ
jgi:hypothetical protein